MSIEASIDLILGGVLLGGIYALIAFGLTLIFGVARVLNLAHGDFLMAGSLVGFLLWYLLGLSPILTFIVVIPLFFVVGLLFERLLIRRIVTKLAEEILLVSIITTVGLSMAMEDAASYYLGTVPGALGYINIAYFLPPIVIGCVSLPTIRFLSLIAIVAVAIVMHHILMKTYIGKMIRATTQDRETAMAMGINVNRISAITSGIGIALAALAGLFLEMITSLSPFSGMPLTIKALAIIVLGGLGSLLGSVVGGLILGIAESYTSVFQVPIAINGQTTMIGGTNWAPIVAVLLLLITLVVKPSGLFGRHEVAS